MQFKLNKIKGTWREVADSCRTTINMDAGTGEPSDKWKRRIVMSEHSPIRQLSIKGKWTNLPYWVSVHICRHWLGIIHWVGTQRSDRTGIDRRSKEQDAPVTHEIEANIQSLINISRKRLCFCASPETRKAWQMVKDGISEVEPAIASSMVKECVYRNGLCPEFISCRYNKTEAFKKELEEYLEGFEHQLSS